MANLNITINPRVCPTLIIDDDIRQVPGTHDLSIMWDVILGTVIPGEQFMLQLSIDGGVTFVDAAVLTTPSPTIPQIISSPAFDTIPDGTNFHIRIRTNSVGCNNIYSATYIHGYWQA